MRSKAAVLYEFRKPVVIDEIDVASPKAHEVLIRVVNAGVCHSEVHVISGDRPAPLPVVLGHEGSGVVESVGPDVTNVKAGDHVIMLWRTPCMRCKQCTSGRPALCESSVKASLLGAMVDGTSRFSKDGQMIHHMLSTSCFSEYTVMHENALIVIPDDIPMPVAATMGCGVLTGVGAALNTAKVRMGSSVAVIGVGGVGLSIIMGAKLAGATQIIAVDIKPDKLETAKTFGATDTVNSAETDPIEAVRKLTGGYGVDYGFEAIGKAAMVEQAFGMTGMGGMTIMVGIPSPTEVVSIPAQVMFGQERTVCCSYYGSTQPYRDVPLLVNLYRSGLLPLDKLISRHFKLDDYNEALRALKAGEVARSVLDICPL